MVRKYNDVKKITCRTSPKREILVQIGGIDKVETQCTIIYKSETLEGNVEKSEVIDIGSLYLSSLLNHVNTFYHMHDAYTRLGIEFEKRALCFYHGKQNKTLRCTRDD